MAAARAKTRKPAAGGRITAEPSARQKRKVRRQKPAIGHQPLGGLPATLAAAYLAPLVNAYLIKVGPPNTVVVPHASQLAGLQDLTVSGQLLNKQRVAYDPKTGTRSTTTTDGGGYTKQELDAMLTRAAGRARAGSPGATGERSYPVIPSSAAAVPPSIATRSASLRPGVPRTRSTAVFVHGYG